MSETPITLLLDAARGGDAAATESLFNAVYAELRVLASSNRRRWRGNETMNTTALIHEVYIRLAGQENASFANRSHFFATASKAMRQVLVNYAEKQSAAKRGGDAMRVTLDETVFSTQASAEELLFLHQLLTDLEAENQRRCEIIECRVFGGMTIEEVAEAMAISPATVKREWKLGTVSLFRMMHGNNGDEPKSGEDL
jgi:RNA polymerase sigma factor (TIGR02999 family)